MIEERRGGSVLLDLVAACSIAILVLLPLLAEFVRWLDRHRREGRRLSHESELVRWRDELVVEMDEEGTPRITLPILGVGARRGEIEGSGSFPLPPLRHRVQGVGRLYWRTGEEVDWIILEIGEGEDRSVYRIPSPAPP